MDGVIAVKPDSACLFEWLVEVVFGLSMFFGFYTRFVSCILALHLFDIAFIVGYNAIGVRDFGLALATASVFLFGSDVWSVDRLFDGRNSGVRAGQFGDIAGIK